MSTHFLRSLKIATVHAVLLIAKDRDRPRSASDRVRPRSSDEDLMKIRSRPRSTTIKLRWKSDTSDASTCHQVSPLIAFTYASFPARVYLMIAWTRVHVISAVLTASNACRVAMSSAKEKRVGTLSHTEKNTGEVKVKYRGGIMLLRYRPNHLTRAHQPVGPPNGAPLAT